MTDYTALYQKFLNQTCSPEEAEALLNYFQTEQGDVEMVKLIEATLEKRTSTILTAQDEQSIRNNELRIMNAIRPKKPVRQMMWRYLSTAAAILLMLSIGILFYINRTDKARQTINDITPGKNTAMLTLSNGKTIQLSDHKTGLIVADDQLTYNDGTAISSSGNDKLDPAIDQIQTITTPRGGTYQVRLPDGSLVTLNAASSLTYATALNKRGERRVTLSGEAYFEIFKDKVHPFIVESNGQQVQVLGTHFNINAYADEPNTKTTLLEGSVKISPSQGTKSEILKPSQQAILDKTFNLRLEKLLNAEKAIAWTNVNGKSMLVFYNDDLGTTLRKVSRWYNVEVVYQTTKNHTALFNGMISRDRNLSSVIQLLEAAGSIHLKIEGRKLIVMD